MVLVGALVGASRVRTVRSVMFASENRVSRPRARLTSRQHAAGCAIAGVAARTWEDCQRARQDAGAMARTPNGRRADKLGGDLEILWRFSLRPGRCCAATFGKRAKAVSQFTDLVRGR